TRHLRRDPQARDVEDLLHRLRELGRRVADYPALALRQDRIARVTAHADHERKAELRLVGVVQAVEARELLVRQRVEAGTRLLAPGIVGDVAGARRLAGEVRMVAHEGELLLAR